MKTVMLALYVLVISVSASTATITNGVTFQFQGITFYQDHWQVGDDGDGNITWFRALYFDSAQERELEIELNASSNLTWWAYEQYSDINSTASGEDFASLTNFGFTVQYSGGGGGESQSWSQAARGYFESGDSGSFSQSALGRFWNAVVSSLFP